MNSAITVAPSITQINSAHHKPGERRRARDDAIPGKWREAVPRNVMNEGPHDDDCDDEADDETDGDRTEADPARTGHQRVVMLYKLQRRRADHGGDCEEEAELRRRAPFDAKRQPAHDRCA